MRRIRRDIHGLARSHHRLRAAEGRLEFTFEDDERLLEIVPVRRGASPGRDVHIDEAELARRIVARKENRISIPNDADVGTFSPASGLTRVSSRRRSSGGRIEAGAAGSGCLSGMLALLALAFAGWNRAG